MGRHRAHGDPVLARVCLGAAGEAERDQGRHGDEEDDTQGDDGMSFESITGHESGLASFVGG